MILAFLEVFGRSLIGLIAAYGMGVVTAALLLARRCG